MSPTDSPLSSGVAYTAPGRGRRWLGRALALLLVLALAGAAWWLVQRSKTGPAVAQPGGPGGFGGPGGPGGMRGAGGPSATVGVATARKGELPVLINALGTVTPAAQVVVRPQVSGVLTEVLFTEGQAVRKGQLLARIDPAPFEQSLAQAQGQRMRDEAQLAAARVTLERYQQLWKQDSVARQDLDTQAALVKQLEGVVQSDKAVEGSARINLEYTRIAAPLGGLIGLRAVDPGNMVTAGAVTGIATITQMAPIDVKFAVPQDRVPEVLKAQRGGTLPVQALDRTRNDVLASGQFLTLDNVIDTTTGTLLGKARFSNEGQPLFPNQFVNVQMKLGATPGVLVPVTAVRTGPQGDYVYVVDGEGTAHMRAVKRGGATVENALIDSGLEPGEVVITEGGDRVQDGGRVQRAGEPPVQAASGAGGGAAGRRRNGASAPAGAAPAASANAASAASRPSGLDRLPPEEREKLQALPPEERRAYIEQLRARRAAREAQGGRQQ
jgi:multidrug efflux system membrane fusion protein